VATLVSPNGQIAMSFAIQPASLSENGSGKLVYSVVFHGKPIIDNSALGLELDANTPLGANVTVAGTQPGSGIDDY
jgi:alpha-glucosidase